MKPLCIYHANCVDGFAAAWVVNKALAGQVEFFEGYYNAKKLPDIVDRDVIIVDFSYKRHDMIQIMTDARSVLVLDHHKTAKEELAGLPGDFINTTIEIDMHRSGARMAWDWFFGIQTDNPLINHIQDRDLWRFAIPGTREIHAYVSAFPQDFAVWDNFMTTEVPLMIETGRILLQKFNKDLADMLKQGTIIRRVHDLLVPCCNLHGLYASEGGNAMCKSSGAAFSVSWFDTNEHRKFSLRSIADASGGFDVSEIAKFYGGGGHRNAAGFSLPHGQWPNEV